MQARYAFLADHGNVGLQALAAALDLRRLPQQQDLRRLLIGGLVLFLRLGSFRLQVLDALLDRGHPALEFGVVFQLARRTLREVVAEHIVQLAAVAVRLFEDRLHLAQVFALRELCRKVLEALVFHDLGGSLVDLIVADRLTQRGLLAAHGVGKLTRCKDTRNVGRGIVVSPLVAPDPVSEIRLLLLDPARGGLGRASDLIGAIHQLFKVAAQQTLLLRKLTDGLAVGQLRIKELLQFPEVLFELPASLVVHKVMLRLLYLVHPFVAVGGGQRCGQLSNLAVQLISRIRHIQSGDHFVAERVFPFCFLPRAQHVFPVRLPGFFLRRLLGARVSELLHLVSNILKVPVL